MVRADEPGAPMNSAEICLDSAVANESRRCVKTIPEQFLDLDPRHFPIVADAPILPVRIPDGLVNYYAFIFCQGGFQQLGITFEQFLLVVDVVKSPGLCPGRDDSSAETGARH
jgi:hypothetical protein